VPEAAPTAQAAAPEMAVAVVSAEADAVGGRPAPTARRMWRRHSAEERVGAVEASPSVGVAEAARLFQVCEQSIRNWRQEAGVGPVPRSATERRGQLQTGARPWPDPADEDSGSAPSDKDEEAAGVLLPEARSVAPEEGRKGRDKAARRYTPSEIAVAVEKAAAEGVAAAAAATGACPHSVYRWLRTAKKAAGEPLGRRWEPTEIEKQRDLEILHEWHKQPGLGPSQIRNQLRRRGVRTSVSTVRRVMEDHGYRPPKVQSHSHHERYEAVRRGQLWHLDFLHRHIHQAPTFTLILLDDYSRFVVGHGVYEAEVADGVIETFEAAVQRHGRPESVMTDKGSAFWSWRGVSRFTRLLKELGVDQIVADEKENNGKAEKFNADLSKEFFDVKKYADVNEMRRALKAHLDWHNSAS
jgi:transposase-like protein